MFIFLSSISELSVSKLWEFGHGVTYLREEGYVRVCVTSCNDEYYIITFSTHLVNSVKIVQGVSRGFSPRLGSRFST